MLKNECKNTESNISYRPVGDYYIPNIALPAEEREITIGKWGLMHKDYLMKNKKVMFNILLTKGTLMQHLAEIDKQAEDLFSRLITALAIAEGVNEHLKEQNQMKWVAMMNNIRNRVEEIINSELIYK